MSTHFYTCISILSLCFFVYTSTQAQAIYDAITLSKYVNADQLLSLDNANEGEKREFYRALYKNSDSLGKKPSDATILNAYRNNPFIEPMLSDKLGAASTLTTEAETRSMPIAFDATSGLEVPSSSILMGLTDFLVKRTKQELSIAFFADFQKAIKNSQELQLLFPSTSKILQKIGKDIYQFKAFWEILRSSFLEDLEALIPNLNNYLQNTTLIKDAPTKNIILDFFKVVEMFYEQKTPVDVINYLSKDAYLHYNIINKDSTQPNLAPISDALKILGLISNSIESKERIGYWVKADVLNQVIRNPIAFNLYLGLLYQNCKNTKIGTKSLADRLGSLYISDNNQSQLKQNLSMLLKKFIDKAEVLVRLSTTIRAKQLEQRKFKDKGRTDAEKETLFNNYYKFTQGVCALILYATEFHKTINESNTNIDATIQQYLGIITELNSVAMNIQKKQYATALIHVLFCLEKLDTSDTYNCRFKQLLKFGSFIATAVKAQNAEEVSAAIEAFALPPSSAAQKKYAKFSVTLNAYVGLSAGEEHLEGLGAKPFYAVTTPIGFNFAIGGNEYGSFSLFASLIDIGALTAYRFEDSNTDELPDLKFENVLAPGAYFVYGVPKYPISVGIGAQLGPNLRSVTNSSLGLNSTKGWRWGAFVAVDIPIISVFNSNKKYKNCTPCEKKQKKRRKKKKID